MDEEEECSVEKRRRSPETAWETVLGSGIVHEEARFGVDVPELEELSDDVGLVRVSWVAMVDQPAGFTASCGVYSPGST